MVVISCAYTGCDCQSEDVTEPIACALLQSHSFSHATAAPAVQAAVPAPVTENRGPKLERLHIGIGVSMEEWNVFTRRWQVFKAGFGIDDISALLQLFQCVSKELGDNLLKSDAEVASRPVADLLISMRRLAVISIATGVLRTDLMQMCQRRDEPFRAFGARVHGKADTCAFFADCQ